jgi:ketosteroid isomerase-like protein
MKRLAASVLAVVVLLTACGGDRRPDPAADTAAITAALQKFPHDFNARDYPALCGLFAEDVVLNYPGLTAERGRDAFCARMTTAIFECAVELRKTLSDPDRQFSYAEPEIREVLVDGDLATVALTWTLTVKDSSGKVLETVKEDGVDVFRRQSDGTWQIHISHAFPACGAPDEPAC